MTIYQELLERNLRVKGYTRENIPLKVLMTIYDDEEGLYILDEKGERRFRKDGRNAEQYRTYLIERIEQGVPPDPKTIDEVI